jgi:hypothetical protein
MALHDYRCLSCDVITRDHDVPMAIGARRGAPDCPVCLSPMDWIPQIGRIDALEPFQEFQIDVDGQSVKVESLRQLRRIERDQEHKARNGEGSPLIWRDYSQDRSNRDVHTLATRLDRPMDDQDRPNLALPDHIGVEKGEKVRQTHEDP